MVPLQHDQRPYQEEDALNRGSAAAHLSEICWGVRGVRLLSVRSGPVHQEDGAVGAATVLLSRGGRRRRTMVPPCRLQTPSSLWAGGGGGRVMHCSREMEEEEEEEAWSRCYGNTFFFFRSFQNPHVLEQRRPKDRTTPKNTKRVHDLKLETFI